MPRAIAPPRGLDFTCLKCGGRTYDMTTGRGTTPVPVCRGCGS